MKIWGNDLKVGDTIYYISDFDIRKSTVKTRDDMSFRMPSYIMENGDRIFVNDYYYTEKEEVIDNVITSLKDKCKKSLSDISAQMDVLKAREIVLKNKYKEIENFSSGDTSDEDFFNISIRDVNNIIGKCFRHDNIVLKVLGMRDDFDNKYYKSGHYEREFLYEQFEFYDDEWHIQDYIWLQETAHSKYADADDTKYIKWCLTPNTEMNIGREGMYQLGKDGKLYVDYDCSCKNYTCFEEMSSDEFEQIRREALSNDGEYQVE